MFVAIVIVRVLFVFCLHLLPSYCCNNKQVRVAEMQLNRATNVLEKEDEIAARPARTWFQVFPSIHFIYSCLLPSSSLRSASPLVRLLSYIFATVFFCTSII
jgi:hypothetical protein